jgi:hypothetical protein
LEHRNTRSMAPSRRTLPLRLALLLALFTLGAASRAALAARIAPPPRPPTPPSPPSPPFPPPAPTLPPAPPGPQAVAFPPEGQDTTEMYYIFGGALGICALGIVRAPGSRNAR